MVAARVREVMENVLIKRNEKGNNDRFQVGGKMFSSSHVYG